MIIFQRTIKSQIIEKLFQKKVIIIYGARQVGKTTLAKNILDEQQKLGKSGVYFNCELDSVRSALSIKETERLHSFLGNNDLIILDEAQNVPEIGKILKIIHDEIPEIQIIATGSSSFDLADKTVEPLTGRHFSFTLHPLSVQEIARTEKLGLLGLETKLEQILRFGTYPEAYSTLEEEKKLQLLNVIASDYLYKDVLKFEGLKKAPIISDLLKLLALQIGHEVSLQSLANKLGISRITVEKYINILEKSFVIYVLRPLSRNAYRAVSKKNKIYFWDLGIRNSLIQNFNPLALREDIGALWENFCVIERIKRNNDNKYFKNIYFWRSYAGQEVDYIEESGGKFEAFEFKWGLSKKIKTPSDFLKTYHADIEKIDRENYINFLIPSVQVLEKNK
jgi:predicted AAA+ superfamily ATPase